MKTLLLTDQIFLPRIIPSNGFAFASHSYLLSHLLLKYAIKHAVLGLPRRAIDKAFVCFMGQVIINMSTK